LFGIPPFNAPSPPQVFENILMRKIDWYGEEAEITPDARQLMERLMCSEIDTRLGTRGATEVKAHSWFATTLWENLMEQKVFFIPSVKNIEDTDYFDSKGMHQKSTNLSDSDENVSVQPQGDCPKKEEVAAKSPENEDFGEAVYKNLPLLEKANQQTMSRISRDFPETDHWIQRRRDSLPVRSPLNPTPTSTLSKSNTRTISANMWLQKRRESLPTSSLSNHPAPVPVSKLSSLGSISNSLPHSYSGSFGTLMEGGRSLDQSMIPTRFSSQSGSIHTGRSNQQLEEYNPSHRNSEGTSGYASSPDRESTFKNDSQAYLDSAKQTLFGSKSKEVLVQPDDSESDFSAFSFFNKPIDALVADSNPVGSKILETILKNLNCRCIRVKNGAEAVQSLMGEVKFDVVFADINISICDFCLT
jgi:serine/threonine-protein kinase RIM15